MQRILFGDNQFFGVNHVSDEKSRSQSIKFKEDKTILKTIDHAMDAGIETFMCTTHDRMINIAALMKNSIDKYENLTIYPCLPYAHKYANAVTELGIMGTVKQYVPGNFFGSVLKGGVAYLSKDYISIMELMVDAELKMFKGLSTPVIFLQNVITDLLLGLGMKDIIKAYHQYIIKKYNAEPGYITMNMPKMLMLLNSIGIKNPIICTSINVDGFRMSGGKELYEYTLKNNEVRAIAMQVLSGGSTPPSKALEYVCSLTNVNSILFGASSKENIAETSALINYYDEKYEMHIA
jgi:hypothetical protein